MHSQICILLLNIAHPPAMFSQIIALEGIHQQRAATKYALHAQEDKSMNKRGADRLDEVDFILDNKIKQTDKNIILELFYYYS